MSALDADGALDRHVLEVGEQPPLDSDGFLRILPADARWLSGTGEPTPAAALVGDQSSYVLLAPARAGKTTVFDALRNLEPEAVDVDLRIWDFDSMGEQLTAAAAIGGPVYLDALDEVALRTPAVYQVLRHHLTTPEAQQVPWRLACRPPAWNAGLSAALGQSLPGFRELQLLPLDRDAATQIVSAAGADPEAFLAALSRARLGRLAATPIRLQVAAQRWASSGELPATPVESIRHEIRDLLEEHDALRPPPEVGLDRQRRVAARLAAITVFCGVQRFITAGADAEGVTSVASLPSGAEPDEPGTPLTPADYRAVLSTALFDAAPRGALRFRHHEYAEYLAADYLLTRGTDRRRLRSLLGVSDEGIIPGSLTGVTIWVSALDPSLTADVVAANAVELTRTGVEIPSDEVRATMVASLLERAASGDVDPEWSLDLTPLVHPHLDMQLREAATAMQRGEQLWWIAKLAIAGGCCTDLTGPLLAAALDPFFPDWARGTGIEAVGVLGDDAELDQLRPLLHLAAEEDPHDELLADVVEVLYPERLETAELLAALRPRRARNLVGGYLMLLSRLADLIPAEDLPAALAWLGETANDDGDAYGRLPQLLVDRGWRHADEPEVCEALGRAAARLVEGNARYDFVRRHPLPWVGTADTERRRALALAAASVDTPRPERAWLHLLDLRLIGDDDLTWLLDQLPALPEPARTRLADCVPRLIAEPSASTADRILTLPADHPVYKPTDHLRGSLTLDSEIAQRARSWRELDAEVAEPPHISAEELRSTLVEALSRAEQDVTRWWRVVWRLSVGEDRSIGGETLFGHDLTRRPGWQLLTEPQRLHVLDLGMRYLREHEPASGDWQGKKSVSDADALPDWSCVYLLTTLVRHDADRVGEVETEVWIKHAPAIVGAWSFDQDEDEALRADLIRLSPEPGLRAMCDAFLEQVDADAALGRHPHYDRLPLDLIAPKVADELGARVLAGVYPQTMTQGLLDLLATHAPVTATTVCRQLRGGEDAELSSRAALHLARLDPPAVLAELFTEHADDAAVLDIVLHLSFTALPPHDITRLARLLLDRYPYAADPPMDPVSWGTDPAEEVRQVRTRVLQHLAELGATHALQELLSGRPESDVAVLRRLLRRARTRAADLAQSPLPPGQLLDLLGRADARLVRNDEDLQEVVIEQLGAIQDELTGGQSRFLWNTSPSAESVPKGEDDISDWVQVRLQARLTATAVADREVQIARPGAGGIGQRMDLAVTTSTATHPPSVARLSVEAKLVNHPGLRSALTEQLVRRYLEPQGRRHGIYLVYWIAPDQRPRRWNRPGPTDLQALRDELEEQAGSLPADMVVRVVVLDLSRPAQ